MANWSGVYQNPNSTGASTGLNGSNTLNDTTANFPLSPSLVNQFVKITGGTGVGQEKRIISNLATVLFIEGTWDIIPDNTSSYEIVLRLCNEDHIVGTFYLYPGVISELEDNATVYIDGNYQIIIGNAREVRWNKSKNTVVTFEANNRNIQGTFNFWTGIVYGNLATNDVKLSYLRIRDANNGLQIFSTTSLGDGSNVHHIICDSCKQYSFGCWGNALIQDVKFENILVINSLSDVLYNNYENLFTMTLENIWINDNVNIYSNKSALVQILKNSVVLNIANNTYSAIDANKKIYLIDNYLNSVLSNIYLIYATTGKKGSIYVYNNVLKMGRELLNSSIEADLKIYSKYNDYLSKKINESYPAIESFVDGAYTLISNHDFITGRNNGINTNVDLSELVTSNHTPPMYSKLSSARTNAQSVFNKSLEVDNIRESDLTFDSIKIKFDCKNSDIGTTVNQDSINGQKILYVANTSEFNIEETIEIGFGTERQEEGIIDSIQDGVSITLKENLNFTHTLAQADSVTQRLRNMGLGFIRYGLNADNLDKSTYIPHESSWGFLYCGFKPDVEEDDGYEWKHTDLEINLLNLKEKTKYYYQCCYYTPFGDIAESTIENFTTLDSGNYSDPLEENVRKLITYKYEGIEKVGTLDLPSTHDVEEGVKFDNETKEGEFEVPLEEDVKNNISYGYNDEFTGTFATGNKYILPLNINIKQKKINLAE